MWTVPGIIENWADVGFGSKAEVTARHVEVCFTPETGHRFALRCYTGFAVSRLRPLGAPTGSTFVFD
jgi:hypothetical protein